MSRHDPPKLSVTQAPPPATKHRCVVGQRTALSAVAAPWCVGIAAAAQVVPPSKLNSAAAVQPADAAATAPTAMHREGAMHETDARGGADGSEPTAVQVCPSCVTAIAPAPAPPLVPTATQLCASKHATEYSAAMPATVVDAQVRPESVDVSTVATSAPPTTTHVVAVGHATPKS